VVGINDQVGGSKRLGLLGEVAYMVGCLLPWIKMVAIVIRLGKIE